MYACPRPTCVGYLKLDTDFLRDAERMGVLDSVPLYFRCTMCARSFWSKPIVTPIISTERICANPDCGKPLGRGRRRFHADECARPKSRGTWRRKKKDDPADDNAML